MSNLTKLEFATLDISGKNYLLWILDVEIHLEAMALQQYREHKFEKYSELISCLVSRLTDSIPFPEVNGILLERNGGNRGRGRGKKSKTRGDMLIILQRGKTHLITKDIQYKYQKGHENKCYRCGIKGHWSRTCHTPKHLVDLYQASLKEKGKGVEVNLAELGDPEDYLDALGGVNITHLEASDFFGDINREA
ncbi:hypothetical protein ACB092_12G060500 [Castanea dentata]